MNCIGCTIDIMPYPDNIEFCQQMAEKAEQYVLVCEDCYDRAMRNAENSQEITEQLQEEQHD